MHTRKADAKKLRFVQIALAERCVCHPGDLQRSHALAVDTSGRLWERFSDMPFGQWNLVEVPDEPAISARQQSKRTATKR